jgi:hypothetical protein
MSLWGSANFRMGRTDGRRGEFLRIEPVLADRGEQSHAT